MGKPSWHGLCSSEGVSNDLHHTLTGQGFGLFVQPTGAVRQLRLGQAACRGVGSWHVTFSKSTSVAQLGRAAVRRRAACRGFESRRKHSVRKDRLRSPAERGGLQAQGTGPAHHALGHLGAPAGGVDLLAPASGAACAVLARPMWRSNKVWPLHLCCGQIRSEAPPCRKRLPVAPL